MEDVIIPFLETVILSEEDLKKSNTSNASVVADSTKKLVKLNEAKDGWQSMLDKNSELYADARAGKLKTAVTHLVADALLQDDKGVDNVKFINGSKAPDANALRAISAIRFENLSSLVVMLFEVLLVCS